MIAQSVLIYILFFLIKILECGTIKILIILSLLAFSSAYAGVRCTTDYFGNQTCTGTGSDYGYRSTEKKDYFGNSTFKDNKGNRTTCKKDYFGNMTCN